MKQMDFEMSIPADLKNLPAIRFFIKDKAGELHVDPEIIHDMILAADEWVTNIIMHGYQGKPGEIGIRLSLDGDNLVVCLRDQAPPFNPTLATPPDLTAPIDQRRSGGLGLHLIRECTDSATYCLTSEGSNELTLRKIARQGA